MDRLFCGFAQTDITPAHPEEVFLDGYGHRVSPARGVRDPLYAKVCFMRYGQTEFVLAVLDLCGLNACLKDHLCALITTLTGINRQSLALCVTHTHAAPACGVLAELPINYLYFDQVGRKISDAIREARTKAVPGGFRFASGGDFSLPYNRRGKNIINRAIPVCAFFDEKEQLQGVIASASCHAVCHTDYTISADYPGVLTQKAMEKYPGVPFLFLQGRGADIDPSCGGTEGINALGEELSHRVFGALENMKGQTRLTGPLKVLFRRAEIPMCYPETEELQKGLKSFAAQLPPAADVAACRYPQVELIWHAKAIAAKESKENPHLTVDLQTVCIGNRFVLVFVPFELLTATGNAIEKELLSYGTDADKCFVIGYANGTNGYLCPSAESRQDGYETRLAAHWYMLPECSYESEQTVLRELYDMASVLLGSQTTEEP